MIRLVLVVLLVVGFLILTIPVLLVEWCIGKFAPTVRDRSSLRMVQWIFRIILKAAGVHLTVIGEENVPKDEPVLYIGNHRGQFDIPITYARCPNRCGYIAKKELEKFPLLRDWMHLLHCLFIDRTDIKQGLKVILTAIDKVKAGVSICVFPEGTRSKGKNELEMLPFHEGTFKIATKTGCAIVPMALIGTSSIFEDHFPRIHSANVILQYGKPIYPDQLDKETKKHIGAYTQGIVLDMLKEQMGEASTAEQG